MNDSNYNGLDENTAIENNENDNEIVLLQQHLITQTTDPHVTKIRGAPSKKRMKSAMEIQKGKKVLCEITNNNIIQEIEGGSRSQRRCHTCGILGHYQKKCPNARNGTV